MNILFLFFVSIACYLLAYFTYGKFVGTRIFELSKNHVCPSIRLEDNKDYVPTKKLVLFGYHFTAIAGIGPIVGPIIGIIWGWLPALLWILLGSIFIGAINDFSALIISVRNKGRSILDYTDEFLNQKGKIIFFFLIFSALLFIIAIFGLIISIIFTLFPESVIPVWSQILISLLFCYLLKRKLNFYLINIIAIFLLFAFIFLGSKFPITISTLYCGIPSTGIWTIILLVYGYISSVLPVTTLLQPRGYLNIFQLGLTMTLLALGIVVGGVCGDLELVAPALQLKPDGAPSLFPFLFIMIACGAVSGFHSLVASGTSSKQIRSEYDTLFVGYGSMLMESFLGLLVLIAVAAGVGMGYMAGPGIFLEGKDAWLHIYSSWGAISGLTAKLYAFTKGAANIMSTIGIPSNIASTLIGVFVASFAVTTLDSAIRIQRYIIGETAKAKLFKPVEKYLSSGYIASGISVGTALILAFASGANGQGALLLWPVAGTINQTIAFVSLAIATLYLVQYKKTSHILFVGIPAIIMMYISFHASILNQIRFVIESNLLLSIINFLILSSLIAIVIEFWKSINLKNR